MTEVKVSIHPRSASFGSTKEENFELTEARKLIADEIKRARELRKMPVETLAQGIGLEDPNLIHQFEAAQTEIPFEYVYAIVNYLNVPTERVENLLVKLYANLASSLD